MAISLVDVLRQSIDELHGRMNAIEAGAVADQRDTLNDVEQTTWDELRAEAEAKTARLEMLVGRGELDARAGELVARMSGGGDRSGGTEGLTDRGDFPYKTPGEYVLAYMRMKHGDGGEAARFTRALADVTTAQTPGLVPPQVTGDVLGTWLGNRPSVDAMSKPPLPPVGMEDPASPHRPAHRRGPARREGPGGVPVVPSGPGEDPGGVLCGWRGRVLGAGEPFRPERAGHHLLRPGRHLRPQVRRGRLRGPGVQCHPDRWHGTGPRRPWPPPSRPLR